MSRTAITLSGSTRFKDTFDELNRQLTLEGYLVDSLGVWDHYPDTEIARQKVLSEVHFDKINRSSIVLVVNRGLFPSDIPYGVYTGVSTNKEIVYAKVHEKTILFANSWISGIPPKFAIETFIRVFPVLM